MGAIHFAFYEGKVGIGHDFDELFEGDARLPAEFFASFCGVAQEKIHFGGAKVAGVLFDVVLPVEANVGKGGFHKFAHGVGLAGGDNVVVRSVLLEHQPHGFNVFGGIAPVAFGVQIAKVEFLLETHLYAGNGAGDFAGDESFTASGRFVVEEDAGGGMQSVGFAVVDSDPVGEDFRAGIRGARIEGGGFFLGRFQNFAIHLGGGGLVEAAVEADLADGFEHAQGANGGDFGGEIGHFEGDFDVGLGGEVVNFVGFDVGQQAHEGGAVGKVAVMKDEAGTGGVAILVEVVDAVGVEGGGTAHQAVNGIAFAEEKFGKVGAVLASDASDECSF